MECNDKPSNETESLVLQRRLAQLVWWGNATDGSHRDIHKQAISGGTKGGCSDNSLGRQVNPKGRDKWGLE